MAISGPNPMAADTPLDFDLLAVVVVDDDVGARDRVAVIDVRLAGWTWWLSEVAPRTRADYSSDDATVIALTPYCRMARRQARHSRSPRRSGGEGSSESTPSPSRARAASE